MFCLIEGCQNGNECTQARDSFTHFDDPYSIHQRYLPGYMQWKIEPPYINGSIFLAFKVDRCYFVLASLVPVLSSFELIDITQGVLFLHTTSILHVMFILNARKYSLNLSKTIKKFGFVEWWIAYLLLIDSEIKQAICFCYLCGFFGQ